MCGFGSRFRGNDGEGCGNDGKGCGDTHPVDIALKPE